MEDALKALFASELFWKLLAEELKNRITVSTDSNYRGPRSGYNYGYTEVTTTISIGDIDIAEFYTSVTDYSD